MVGESLVLFQLDADIKPGFKCAVLACSEEDEEFLAEVKDGHVSQCYLHDAIPSEGKSEERNGEDTLLLQIAAQTMMNLTRPLSFQL